MKQRYSKKREQILEALKKAHGGLSAAKIHTLLPKLDLTTIYRNLEVFVSQGDVKKLNLKGKEAVYEYQVKPHHHAICVECERVIHFTAPDEQIKKLLGVKDFQVDELEVTVRGICTHKK
jgi:Fur family ferric uptake transcriptional regulator